MPPTLTETVIDIADRHTTLYYQGAKPPAGPLPFHAEDAYCALHEAIGRGIEYQDAASGRPPTLLGRLKRGYSDNRYWLRYVGKPEFAFPSEAWRYLLPIDASLTRRIVHVPDPHFAIRVSPKPTVRLYPFGWSTWISLRLLGDHSVSDLAAFLERLFNDGALQYENGPPIPSVRKLFDDVAEGVRADAFGSEETHDSVTPDIVVVATVMAKHGGSLALGGLSMDERAQLRRIAQPYGPPPGGPFEQRVRRLPPGNSDLEYLVHVKHGRFLWVDHLLDPIKSEYVDLRCYHNNSFVSLIHAWHLHALLDAVTQQAPLSPVAFNMAQAALRLLGAPGYRCASLMRYLEESDLKDSMTKAAKLAAPKGKKRRPPAARK